MPHKMLKGNSKDIIATNVKGLCANGMSEAQATACAMKHARKGTGKTVVDKVVKFDTHKPYGKVQRGL